MLKANEECIMLSNKVFRTVFHGQVHRVKKGTTEFRHPALHSDHYEMVYWKTPQRVRARKEDHPALEGGESMPVFKFVRIDQKMHSKPSKKGKRKRSAA